MSGKILDTISHPLTVGVVGGVAGKLMSNGNSIPLFGYNLDPAIAYGAAIAGASLLGQIGQNYVVPMLPEVIQPVSEIGFMIAAPVSTGIASTVVMMVLDGNYNPFDYRTQAMIGIGAEVAGSYVHKSLVEPYISRM